MMNCTNTVSRKWWKWKAMIMASLLDYVRDMSMSRWQFYVCIHSSHTHAERFSNPPGKIPTHLSCERERFFCFERFFPFLLDYFVFFYSSLEFVSAPWPWAGGEIATGQKKLTTQKSDYCTKTWIHSSHRILFSVRNFIILLEINVPRQRLKAYFTISSYSSYLE